MKYKSFHFFIIRFPFLSYNLLNTIMQDIDSLLTIFSNNIVKEAIFLSSPTLYSELLKLVEGKMKEPNKKNRLIYSFERYVNRMSTRCTPFGLFAGCALGKIEDKTDIVLKDSYTRKTRLDMHFLCALYDNLIKIPKIKYKIKYYRNTSLYSLGKKYRYIECQYDCSKRNYQITEIDQSNYLKKVLKKVSRGADISTLVGCLVNDNISHQDAVDFVSELIDSQILVGELNQSITGEDFFSRIIELVKSVNDGGELLFELKEIKSLLSMLDEGVHERNLYQEIIAKIDSLSVPYEKKYLFQVDLIKKTSKAHLGKEILNEVKLAMTFLNKVTSSIKNETLSQFQQDFFNRYEEKEVPIMEALDLELGIGYPSRKNNGDPSPLIDDLILPQIKMQKKNTFNVIQSILYNKTIECLSQKKIEIEFTDDDVKDFSPNWDDLPPTIYTLFEIIRNNPDDILIKLDFCSGSCGANLLARFSHADDGIAKFVEDIVLKEQKLFSDRVLAEIVHLPEARSGNVLSRPHIRNYELLYMANSDLKQNNLLDISDLMISIRNDRLIIRSKKLDKEIIPRLTTAHNYHNGLPVYRFLCDMQVPTGRNALYLDWGQYEYTFKPRVRYNNTILSPATWFVNNEEIKFLLLIQDDTKLIPEIRKWRKNRFIPQYVLMTDSDNKLHVDWENELSVSALLAIVKNREVIILTEFLFEPENAIAKSADGVYLNECIVPFYKDLK